MRAIQVGLIDTGSSTRSLSVLLSAMETSLRTQTPLEITQWVSVAIISTRIRPPCILAVATIWGWHLFSSEPRLCGYYLRVVTIQGWRLIKEVCKCHTLLGHSVEVCTLYSVCMWSHSWWWCCCVVKCSICIGIPHSVNNTQCKQHTVRTPAGSVKPQMVLCDYIITFPWQRESNYWLVRKCCVYDTIP